MEAPPARQRRRILIATATGAGAAAAAWLAASGAARRDWPHGSPLAFPLDTLPEGQLRTVAWAGRPVWLLRRSAGQIAALGAHEAELADPESRASVQPPGCRNRHRSLDPGLFVAIGLCTHQGCTPARSGDRFLCPCHTSRYDLAGRVFRDGPAPANLVIPAYRIDGRQLVIGEDA